MCPEGESEIVAGHMTEYSGFKYATFFLAEYLGMFAVSGLAVTLFLGGWHAPLPWLAFIPVLRLVLREIVGLAFRFHLDPRHAAAHSRRSDDEFRLEVHAADGVHLPRFGGGLALQRPPFVRLALVVRRHCRRLLRALACFSTPAENSRRALIVSPNEHRRLRHHRNFHARRSRSRPRQILD